MGDADLHAVVESTSELKERQETPDPPEALACVPSLQLAGEQRPRAAGPALS